MIAIKGVAARVGRRPPGLFSGLWLARGVAAGGWLRAGCVPSVPWPPSSGPSLPAGHGAGRAEDTGAAERPRTSRRCSRSPPRGLRDSAPDRARCLRTSSFELRASSARLRGVAPGPVWASVSKRRVRLGSPQRNARCLVAWSP